MWGRIGAHLSAAFRLRRGARESEQPAEAILDPNGKLLHAETLAKGSAAREQLREAARSMDRARSAQGRLDSESVLWWLANGRWSINSNRTVVDCWSLDEIAPGLYPVTS